MVVAAALVPAAGVAPVSEATSLLAAAEVGLEATPPTSPFSFGLLISYKDSIKVI